LIESLWISKKGSTQHSGIARISSGVDAVGWAGNQFKGLAEILEAFSHWPVVTPRADDLLQVMGFQEKFGLSFYDASIIQSALAGQCSVLYSEGLTSGQSYAGVKIVNPFLEAASGKDGD